MFFYLIITLHFLLCIGLIGLVLLQQGKGADLGAAFGSGGANSIFGAAGAAPFIVKLTTGVCVAFMITSIVLIKHYGEFAAFHAGSDDGLQGSVLQGKLSPNEGAGEKPAAPATQPEAAAPSGDGQAAKPGEEQKAN